MSGCETTNPIFILRQLQEKYLAKMQNVNFAFEDFQKALDHVSKDVVWWALMNLGVKE